MLQSVLVPNTISIEYEQFSRLHVTEYHFLIEHITEPHQVVSNGVSIDLLKIFDINHEFSSSAEMFSFMEDHLLSVREHLCVPRKVLLLHPSSGTHSSEY